jgi:hypothetical protein
VPALERRLRLGGAAILFVSAQSQGKAYSVAAGVGVGERMIDDLLVEFLGDPSHDLARYLSEADLLHPIVTNPDGHKAHGWYFDYGLVQPAIVAVVGSSSSPSASSPPLGSSAQEVRLANEIVLFSWAMRPSFRNAGGQLERPDPFEAWDYLERKLAAVALVILLLDSWRLAHGELSSLDVLKGLPASVESVPFIYRLQQLMVPLSLPPTAHATFLEAVACVQNTIRPFW